MSEPEANGNADLSSSTEKNDEVIASISINNKDENLVMPVAKTTPKRDIREDIKDIEDDIKQIFGSKSPQLTKDSPKQRTSSNSSPSKLAKNVSSDNNTKAGSDKNIRKTHNPISPAKSPVIEHEMNDTGEGNIEIKNIVPIKNTTDKLVLSESSKKISSPKSSSVISSNLTTVRSSPRSLRSPKAILTQPSTSKRSYATLVEPPSDDDDLYFYGYDDNGEPVFGPMTKVDISDEPAPKKFKTNESDDINEDTINDEKNSPVADINSTPVKEKVISPKVFVIKSPAAKSSSPKFENSKAQIQKTPSPQSNKQELIENHKQSNKVQSSEAILSTTESMKPEITKEKSGKASPQKIQSPKASPVTKISSSSKTVSPRLPALKILSPKEPTPTKILESTPTTQPTSATKLRPCDDPIYKKPFDSGWKREIVYRAITAPGAKERGETYYKTPNGKKLRTRHEIQQHLTPGLSLENFTFSKDPLNAGPEHETVRVAKLPGNKQAPSPVVNPVPARTTELGKRIPKPKAPKGASPPPEGWTPGKAAAAANYSLTPRSKNITQPESVPLSKSATTISTKNDNPRDVGITNMSATRQSTSLSIVSSPTTTKKIVSQSHQQLSPKITTNILRNDRSSDSPQMIGVLNGKKYLIIKTPTNITIAKPSAGSSESTSPQSPQKRMAVVTSSASPPTKIARIDRFAQDFFTNVSLGYDILFNVFQYLKVQELLRAGCVSRLWNAVANHRLLWKTVRMKNSQVNDWLGLANTLRRNEAENLDLRKMILQKDENEEQMWANFAQEIQSVKTLKQIDFGKCPSEVIQNLFETAPQLICINALSIKSDSLNLCNLQKMQNLQELRLKTTEGCNLESDLNGLELLTNLKHLSLTSINELGKKNCDVIANLKNLESLELGECSALQFSFAENVLLKLQKLERLRLERSSENVVTCEILSKISQLLQLSQLELINFDVRDGFEEHIVACKNIKKFLLIPTYVSQSATTNHIILSSMQQLSTSLESFIWGVTVELLRVTALYVDQVGAKDKKTDESIPVLKPVPGMQIVNENEETSKSSDIQQVDILPLVKIREILSNRMPSTKLKILKLSYQSTWRQNFIE